MTIDKGLALVSVADVLFFNPETEAYMGEGLALTNSTLNTEVQSIEQRGGYLNALLFDIKHSKNVTVELESATFKMEYLAFQTGTPIVSGLSNVYKFDECVEFKNGKGNTKDTPIDKVYVRMPNGVVKAIVPTEKAIDIGMPGFNGSLQVVYKYNKVVDEIAINTKTQPLTVKAVMKIHVLNQDGVEGYIEITIPRLKFNGNITLNLTADTVSSFGLSGTAQEYAQACGEALYADVKYIASENDAQATPVEGIVASPNVLTLENQEKVTAQIIGVRSAPYTNVVLDNSKVTFATASGAVATVDSETGVISAAGEGDTTITATYEGLQDIISVHVNGMA